MASKPDVLYRYRGKPDGPFISGLPRRDLVAKDLDAVSAADLARGVASGLYAPVEAEKSEPPKADTNTTSKSNAAQKGGADA